MLVLKGAPTVVAGPEGEVFVNPTGNAGLATAGSGDVLTGIIAGLVAQGVAPLEAAYAGVLHSRPVRRSARVVADGPGFLAGEIARHIPLAMAALALTSGGGRSIRRLGIHLESERRVR